MVMFHSYVSFPLGTHPPMTNERVPIATLDEAKTSCDSQVGPGIATMIFEVYILGGLVLWWLVTVNPKMWRYQQQKMGISSVYK